MTRSSRDARFYFNGIDGATGGYGLQPLTGEELSHLLHGEAAPDDLHELQLRLRQGNRRQLRAIEGVDPKRLQEAGWGVIFAHDADPRVGEALAPLLELRRRQAGDYFRIFAGGDGYRRGETKSTFLARHGAGPGPADPAIVPYYLLLVGSPETIPFRFQSQLDVQYAVGRIDFESAEHYAAYAAAVVAAESGRIARDREIGFFGTDNADDPCTRSSCSELVAPLAESLAGQHPDWRVRGLLGEEATKASLSDLIGGPTMPALLFTASHGLELSSDDPRQPSHQGALVCQDWPGPRNWHGAMPQDHYLAADDLPADARLEGLISFHFACFFAGTPRRDEFARLAFRDHPAAQARRAFTAALPQRMLSHSGGAALAAIGHVDRAWGCSFAWQGAGPQLAVFESTLERLLDGHPVGSAVEYFNQRYAELSTMLAAHLQEVERGAPQDPRQLAALWTATNDAGAYVVLGDPAVRLSVDESDPAPPEPPLIELAAAPGGRSRVPAPRSDDQPSEDGSKAGLGMPARPQDPAPSPPPPPPPRQPDTGEKAFSAETTDDVHFSAYHPDSMHVGETYPMLVYAHLQGMIDAIAADAGEVLGIVAADYRESGAAGSARVRTGTEITIVPEADGVAFHPPRAELTWSGAFQRTEFEMEAAPEVAGEAIDGSIACYVGPLLIADIALPIRVAKAGEELPATETGRNVQTAKMYQAVFASYSHSDTAIVEAMEFAYRAVGMDYLRDVMTLKSGQNWSEELLRMIEQADIFQLFWSEQSRRSPYVEQEWLHALDISARKSPTFSRPSVSISAIEPPPVIRPIYWQRPLPTVPAALYHLHFAPIDPPATIRAAVQAAQPATPPAPEQQLDEPTNPAPVVSERIPRSATVTDEDLETVTVSTYTAADPAAPESARLRARTRISLAGDIDVYLPAETDGKDVVAVHNAAVREALRARVAYLERLAKPKLG